MVELQNSFNLGILSRMPSNGLILVLRESMYVFIWNPKSANVLLPVLSRSDLLPEHRNRWALEQETLSDLV